MLLPPVFGTMLNDGSADFRFAQAARRRHRDFLRVADVGHVARHAAAVERRAGVQAVHLNARLVVAAAGAAEDQHPGRDLDVEVGAGLASSGRGNEHHDAGVRPRGRHRRDHVVRRSVTCRRTLCVSTIGVSPVTVIVSCERADLQVRVDRRGERAGQLDPFALDGAESGQRERDRVGAGPQVDDAVLAGAVGDGGTDFFDQRVARRFDGHARQHGAGRVLDDAGDGGLGECRGGQHHQAREAEQQLFQHAHTLSFVVSADCAGWLDGRVPANTRKRVQPSQCAISTVESPSADRIRKVESREISVIRKRISTLDSRLESGRVERYALHGADRVNTTGRVWKAAVVRCATSDP